MEQQNKKCTECVNSKPIEENSTFVYKCSLSKKKQKECLCEIVDHFAEP